MEPVPKPADDMTSLEDFQRHIVYMFDLDDTLYAEGQYLEAAYRAIALVAENTWGLSSTDTLDYLTDSFRAEGRSGLFDRLHSRWLSTRADIPERDIFVRQCLDILRSVPCRMELYPHVPEVLRGIRDRGARALVVTNGNPRQQRNKVAAIDWRGNNAFLEFHYAAETAPKPDPAVFVRNILPRHGLDRTAYLFVGDSPSDRVFAHNCGVGFMWADRFQEIFRHLAGSSEGM